MECTTGCKNEVLRCLKDKIIKSGKVGVISELIEQDKVPKTYTPSKEEIEKDKKRRACNRKSALQSRERQKKEYKENRKLLEELKEYHADIKGKFKRMKNNKTQFMTLLSAWMTEEQIHIALNTKLQTESFDFLLSKDNSSDQCSAQSSSSGIEFSTEDSDSVADQYKEENDDGSSDGFDALSDRIQCDAYEQTLVTGSEENVQQEKEYMQYAVMQTSEGSSDAYTYGSPVSLIPLGEDQFVLVKVDNIHGVDFQSKTGSPDSDTQIIYVMSDGTIYKQFQ